MSQLVIVRPQSGLATLFASGRSDDAPVAFGRDGVRRFADLRGRVAALARELRALGGGRYLVYSDDSYAFAVALFACAYAGVVALLAPNRQPGTLATLAANVDGAVVDPGVGAAELARLPRRAPLELVPLATPRLEPLAPDAPFAELSTSGTSGAGKPVPKTLGHFERELSAFEATFGARVGPDARVFATVTHQHLYGLSFRLLWPLATGRPFAAEGYLHSEELLPRLRAAGPFALVTTPAILRRLRAESGLAELGPSARALFSAGGPLDDAVARELGRALGRPPVEIFGSTETGAVAWREQASDGPVAPFRALPGVELALAGGEQAGQLVVRSAFTSLGRVVAEGAVQETVMGDRAELLAPDSFRLLGRADRIVKIGEKRLSLPEMESVLVAHPWIADAALVPLELAGETRVGAVVALSPAGETALAGDGRRALGARLADHLAAYWDRVLLPRAWRYVAELPRDPQGKVTRAALEEILAASPERAPVVAPVLLAERRGADSLERDLRVPAELAFLDGHFPGRPIVAGVVQVHWALEAAAALLGEAPRVRALVGLRFRDVLLPGDEPTLVVARTGDALRFELRAGERVFASGRALLEPARAESPA